MSDTGYSTPDMGSIHEHNGYTIGRDSASDSYTSAQKRFHEELRAAVREHFQDLREIAENSGAKAPFWYLAVKRCMDIFVSVIGLILLSPVFLIVAALIKSNSRGPVFFGQERVGKDGKLFKMYKFRTMVIDAEKKTGPVWAAENDPRITAVGRFLRKNRIDEFPQLLNVIRGNMTMVGPRPERPFFVDHFMERIPGYSRRLDVTPGITGLAQLRNGYDRNATDVILKLKYDVTYIRNMKMSTDLRLLAETFFSGLTGKL
jgi:lipopolysaccharide/colanic/teichoic acid biosynthesis glycosyltransferase